MRPSNRNDVLPAFHVDRSTLAESPPIDIECHCRPTTAAYPGDPSFLSNMTPLTGVGTPTLPSATNTFSLDSTGEREKTPELLPHRTHERVKAYLERLTSEAVPPAKETRKRGVETPPLPDLAPPLTIFDAVSKKEKLEHLDTYLARFTSTRHGDDAQRNGEVRRVVGEIARLYPGLRSICHQLSRYLRETRNAIQEMKSQHQETLERQEREIYKRFETFFENKMLAVLREKGEMEDALKKRRAEVMKLRKERDEDLTQLKEELLRRLAVCERKEEEFCSFRQLIAAVFNTNGLLTKRVEDLEALLTRHRIQIPPAKADLFSFSTSSAGPTKGGGGGGA